MGALLSGIVSEGELREIVAEARRRKQRVIWTNGCFDLIHAGHVRYLKEAKSLGEVLVVGVNSDKSVAVLKSPDRPIVKEDCRAEVIAAIRYVDFVVVFDEPSPLRMLKELKPDVYVKGGDYTIDTIDQEERRTVEAYGGQIAILPKLEGLSTTELVNRVMKTGERT